MLARFLVPSWQLIAVVGVVLPVLSGAVAGWKAYNWGASQERANQILAAQVSQRIHDKEVEAKQAEIDRISREHSQAENQLSLRVSELQQQLLEQSNEDFLCPADQPVFSERLRDQINSIGRD